MLKYLVIHLSDDAVSYCHYENIAISDNFIQLDTLKEAIRFGLMENLNIQFVYPKRELPEKYVELIETIDSTKIVPCKSKNIDIADFVVCNGIEEANKDNLKEKQMVILRISRNEITELPKVYESLKNYCSRLNVVITDIDKFSEEDFKHYKEVLRKLGDLLKEKIVKNDSMQVNLLFDRILLTEMRNCNAGNEVITLMPNGHFYPCAAFYYDNQEEDFGDLVRGIKIKNPQLFKLDYAPICRNCDAFHCHRCVWLNRRTTLEVNTPSHEQCVISHLERNESARVLLTIREEYEFMPEVSIIEKDCLDPFEDIIKNKIRL
jgi:CXXX repeat peptide maturase